jgi:hypothetical protein
MSAGLHTDMNKFGWLALSLVTMILMCIAIALIAALLTIP